MYDYMLVHMLLGLMHLEFPEAVRSRRGSIHEGSRSSQQTVSSA